MFALRFGYDDIVRKVTKMGATDMSKEYDANQIMLSASFAGHTEIVKRMLAEIERSSYIIEHDQLNLALICASGGGCNPTVELLRDHGADDYDEAMVAALTMDHIDIFTLLLERCTVDRLVNKRVEIMGYAAARGMIEIVELLLERGIRDYSAGLIRAAKGGHLNIIKLLLDQGGRSSNMIEEDSEDATRNPWSISDSDYYMALYDAASNGSVEIVNFILDLGVVTVDDNIMYGAARSGDVGMIKSLLEREPKGVKDFYPRIMSGAAMRGHFDAMRLLLDHGEKRGFFINGSSDYMPSLCSAAGAGHVEMVKLMLSLGEESEALNSDTEFTSSASRRLVRLIDYNTAMVSAARSGHMEIVNIMLSHGADEYSGALIATSRTGHVEIIQLMLSCCERTNVQQTVYDQAMDIAKRSNRSEVVSLIEEWLRTFNERGETH